MFALRYLVFVACGLALLVALLGTGLWNWHWGFVVPPALLTALGVHDVLQRRHAVLRNYPIIGHLRYLIETVRPEIQQYLVDSDTDEVPFARLQRSVVYQRAKGEPDGRSFGTKLELQEAGYEWVNHSMSPSQLESQDFRIPVGQGRKKPYALSVFNISGMSFGALSANAIMALNKGAQMGGFAHDTGEGSVSPYHLQGGDLIWQLGSGYFGCRDENGKFDPERFAATAANEHIKMIEIKLSQGAKPGHGGILPAAKITPEISRTRGVPMGVDCVSPSSHSEFSTPKELLAFIERLRELSGDKPVGFKLCIGHPWEFMSLAKAMHETGILPDFIVVDGAEGGTGAAPVEFTDHVGAPLQEGLLLVHNTLVGVGLRDQIKIGASGKIITAFDIAKTLALGADYCNSARGFMFAVGCIQAGVCGTGRCPTGVATQDPQRQRAIDVGDKSQRVANFHRNTMHALKELVQATGLLHPSEFRPDHILRRLSRDEAKPISMILTYLEPGDLLAGKLGHPVYERYWNRVSSDSFGLIRP
ncbi:FMN-binding glutamate synthase family protein [Achromobacter sp. F4_2707]|uniref:FMN-binding glutamate synthase family protein n=1 Tax=Achromobacter sp. F4_2707 TaxID=3114286 RepID=UPI0039C72CB1